MIVISNISKRKRTMTGVNLSPNVGGLLMGNHSVVQLPQAG